MATLARVLAMPGKRKVSRVKSLDVELGDDGADIARKLGEVDASGFYLHTGHDSSKPYTPPRSRVTMSVLDGLLKVAEFIATKKGGKRNNVINMFVNDEPHEALRRICRRRKQ